MMPPCYRMNLFWSGKDACWVADVPDLRSCTTHGETPSEALANVREAIDGWIESACEAGLEVPPPRYRPAIYAARITA